MSHFSAVELQSCTPGQRAFIERYSAGYSSLVNFIQDHESALNAPSADYAAACAAEIFADPANGSGPISITFRILTDDGRIEDRVYTRN